MDIYPKKMVNRFNLTLPFYERLQEKILFSLSTVKVTMNPLLHLVYFQVIRPRFINWVIYFLAKINKYACFFNMFFIIKKS